MRRRWRKLQWRSLSACLTNRHSQPVNQSAETVGGAACVQPTLRLRSLLCTHSRWRAHPGNEAETRASAMESTVMAQPVGVFWLRGCWLDRDSRWTRSAALRAAPHQPVARREKGNGHGLRCQQTRHTCTAHARAAKKSVSTCSGMEHAFWGAAVTRGRSTAREERQRC